MQCFSSKTTCFTIFNLFLNSKGHVYFQILKLERKRERWGGGMNCEFEFSLFSPKTKKRLANDVKVPKEVINTCTCLKNPDKTARDHSTNLKLHDLLTRGY